jgi:hypothetical protein
MIIEHHIKRKLLLSLMLTAWFSWIASPQLVLAGELEDRVLKSVVLLKSAVREYCASGVLLDTGQILTAAHVANELCVRGQCYNVVVGITKKVGAPPEETTGVLYQVQTLFTGIDLAILSPPEGEGIKGSFTLTELTDHQIDPNLTVASYPRCGLLELQTGTVTDESTLGLEMSAEGHPGSSGGAVMAKGALLGIVTRGVSESGTAWGKLFGTPFPLRAIRLNPAELETPSSDAALSAQISRFIQYHRNKVLGTDDPGFRKWSSLELIAAIRGFAYQVAMMPDIDSNRFRSLFFSDHYVGELLDYILGQPVEEKVDPIAQQFELLALIMTAESKGLNKNFRTPLNVQDYETLLERAGRADLKDHLILLEKSKYPGSEVVWLSTSLWLILPGIPILFMIGWTLGYVWASEPKGKRLLFSVVVLLLWPLTFFAYLLRRRRLARKKKAATQ